MKENIELHIEDRRNRDANMLTKSNSIKNATSQSHCCHSMSSITNDEPLSIGILGAARIARKNCRAASHLSTECRVIAIASRSKQKGDDFVSAVFSTIPSTPAPTVYGGDEAYSALLADEACDAVYIPLPSKLHYEYVIAALKAGKHVLLEKPVANSADEYRDMLRIASENGRFLMDGTMFVHHPRTIQFVRSVPNPTRVHFNFTFDGDENFHRTDIRTKNDGDFMGCIGDLGWYCIRMGLLVFSDADYSKLTGLVSEVQVTRFVLNEGGVPLDAECMVYFANVSLFHQMNEYLFQKTDTFLYLFQNCILSFHCSFMHPLNQTVQISGRGCSHTSIMTDAILPFEGDILTYNLVKQDLMQYDEITTTKAEVMECDNSLVQEVLMWKNFNVWARTIERECTDPSTAVVLRGEPWSGNSNGIKEANSIASFSLVTQLVLDGLMESIQSEGLKVKISYN